MDALEKLREIMTAYSRTYSNSKSTKGEGKKKTAESQNNVQRVYQGISPGNPLGNDPPQFLVYPPSLAVMYLEEYTLTESIAAFCSIGERDSHSGTSGKEELDDSKDEHMIASESCI